MPQESEYNGDPSFECVPQFKECLEPPQQFHDLPGHTTPCGVSMLLCACVLCACVVVCCVHVCMCAVWLCAVWLCAVCMCAVWLCPVCICAVWLCPVCCVVCKEAVCLAVKCNRV